MEALWFARRAALHCQSQQHPDWTYAHLAATVGGSESFVKKWLTRFKRATTADHTLYQSRSHARHTPPQTTPQAVIERILALRDEPPAHLRRVPGPRTILAFLHNDPDTLALALPLPRSTRTVWKVLRHLPAAPPPAAHAAGAAGRGAGRLHRHRDRAARSSGQTPARRRGIAL